METKIYRIPPEAKARYQLPRTLVLSIIAALVMTHAALFNPPHSVEQWTYLVLLLAIIYSCIAFCIWFIWVLNGHLEVTETHIIQHAPRKSPVALAWSEVSRVQEKKGSSPESRLYLYSASGSTKIVIESVTEDYEALRGLISERTGKEIR